MQSEHILDASAVVALLYDEPGAKKVLDLLEGGAISAVNVSEVLARMVRDGEEIAEARKAIEVLRLDVVPFNEEYAYEAGGLIAITKDYGLSLGDRACLATARKLKLPVFTSDRQWAKVKRLGVAIHLIR